MRRRLLPYMQGHHSVASWMRSNRLQLNADKTEVLWCTTGRRKLKS